jgi:NADPH:quinone reductase-like Zn-dependent oxidoreductase
MVLITSYGKQMKAILMHEYGNSGVLHYETVPTPRPSFGEVLVQVYAATVNHTDIFHRTGQFSIQKSMPHILGMDVAAEILEVGPEVTDWRVGDRVVATFEDLGRARNGSYAEYTTLPASQLHRIPDNLSYIAAASIGLAFCTAWNALFNSGAIQPGVERVVIHAASSGVGTAAIQIARWQKVHVCAISQSDKLERLKALGADVVIDRSAPDVVAQVQKATQGQGASLVLDLVGQSTLQSSIEMLAPGGRVITVGTLSGDYAQINVMDLIMKNATVRGSFHAACATDFERILQLFAEGTFQPVTECVLPLQKARVAHDLVEAQATFGKVILVPTWVESPTTH